LVEVHAKKGLKAAGKCRILAITKQIVADKLAEYLRHDISLAELVSWAEATMMDGEFAENDMEAVTSVIARLGLADVSSGWRGKIASNYSVNLAMRRAWTSSSLDLSIESTTQP
jgi:hypothetical protein